MLEHMNLRKSYAEHEQINPYLECIIETNPDALKLAEELDRERKLEKIRGPLHGVPVLVKDASTSSWSSYVPTRLTVL